MFQDVWAKTREERSTSKTVPVASSLEELRAWAVRARAKRDRRHEGHNGGEPPETSLRRKSLGDGLCD